MLSYLIFLVRSICNKLKLNSDRLENGRKAPTEIKKNQATGIE